MSKKKNSSVSQAAAELGSLGGKIGGPRRAESLSAEERHEIAKRAANARWRNEGLKRRKKSQQLHDRGEGKKPK